MLVVNRLRYVILHPTARDFVNLVKLRGCLRNGLPNRIVYIACTISARYS